MVKFMEKYVKEGKCRVGGGVCVTIQRKKKLRENVGWVVGCRVGGGM